LHDPFAVECAILFHDAIYEPTRTDNEQRSVALAKKMLAGVVPDDVLRRTVRLIEATQRHLVPDDLTAEETEDCRIFLDMDLSILGGDAVAFDRYEAGVRHEYRHVPETLFRQGRAAVLERFLARDPLYLSAWGRARFEAKGRENLRRSLRALREAPG
jgi:predicted metal-dependent HD superfamily phosphohydrolase